MAFLGPSLRRKKISERPAARSLAAILLSLLLNGLLFGLVASMGAFELAKPKPVRQVALAPLTADQWNANRAIAGQPPPPTAAPVKPPPPPPTLAKPVPPPPPPPDKQGGQLVQVAPSKDSKKPDHARFLSDRDNSVDKETVSRHAGERYNENILPTPSDGAKKKAAPEPQEKGEEGLADASKAGHEGQKAPRGTGADKLQLPKQAAQDKLALEKGAQADRPGEVQVAPKEDRERVAGLAQELQVPGAAAESDAGSRKRGSLDARLLPDQRTMERIAGGPSMDRIDGVEAGEATALNTGGFKYATYINRVFDGIVREWNPGQAYRVRDPDGTLYPMQDRTTGAVLVLDEKGGIAQLLIVKKSGLEFLDQEVVRAVRTAGPFPNPPAGLADPDGKVRLAFQLTLEFSARPHLRALPPPGQGPGQRPYAE